jgi:hypothetical protein
MGCTNFFYCAQMYAWNWDPPKASTGAYNCRPITGGTLYSLHAYGIAGINSFFQ